MALHRLAMALGCALAAGWPGAPCAQPVGEPTAPSRIAIADHVRDASRRFGIPEAWIYAIIRIESAGRVRAVSSAGAMGLMQLMPGTWARQRARFALRTDPFDPRDNIMAGTSYLREMYDRYGAAGFLAAYNAGPGRYEQWRDRGRPLPLETRRYVAAIAPLLHGDGLAITASLQPASGAPRFARRGEGSARQGRSDLDHEASAHPFARPAVPRHDLFAPVSTVRDQ
ncbi:lytic transglycosylase [Porphyrobacter sp. TH134]|uniref:lytic transglycosylase domain-containing protein n=1 Tax=Porphyrobacter sp. TH134 TaxID=2067450 RepID=UPI000C7C14C1|nr:lytic transglycosylase domain-containing protein [Porphyrobacter sp. TH134]PLK22684.1 lytic transglycosylase [Porphyrobacter sp. TH134]